MRLIDRYIFLEWVKAFIMAIGATLSILIIEDVQDDGLDFLKWDASFFQVCRYYFFLIPTFLPVVLPLSFLVSLLFVLGNLHRNYEIIAMRASGLHIFAITRSLWFSGALLSCVLLYLNADLVPRFVEQARLLRDNIKFAKHEEILESPDQVGLVYSLAFDNSKDGRLWFMNRYSQRTNEGFGINVYSRDGQDREVSRVMAQEGYYDETQGNWTFLRGREMSFDPETGDAYFNKAFDQKVFEDYSEEPGLMLTLAKDTDDLSFFELRSLLERIPPEDNPMMYTYQVRYHSILSSPFTCLIVVGIAIPFAVAGVRTNPMIGVSKAIGLFLVYYVLASLSWLLGEQQILRSVVAAWLPVGMMFVCSLFLVRRVA